MAAVSDAESTFWMNSGDEDALTGALGQAMAMPRNQVFFTPEGIYKVDIGYTKLRGRGKNAPERIYGSDGIFQIRILDESGNVIRSKGLPFQSKKNWKGKNKKLFGQVGDMERITPGGIVVDFNSAGYGACRAKDVILAEGDRTRIKSDGKLHRLGQLLGDDFLECNIGVLNLFYDYESEQYKIDGGDFHIITTGIEMPNNALQRTSR
ncbi:hypothetical protein [Billgrantia desiderata]|uniref:hypothetical protein n=1 Tax=Billgrantia desiderata TaxID=52021 RepID=UPI001F22623F|nr:hypothetical protein [Halomonas desiderata]